MSGGMEWIRFVVGAIFIVCGIVTFLLQLIGVFKFKYVLNRMHAAAMGDTMGFAFCIIGLIIFRGICMDTWKLALILLFFWVASPVASHMLSRMEITTNEALEKECEIFDNVEDVEK